MLLCIASGVECAASTAVFYEQAFLYKLFDRIFNRCLADGRTKLHHFTLGKLSNLTINSLTYHFGCRKFFFYQIDTFFKVTIGRQYDLKEILDKRRRIIFVFCPAFLTLFQSFVVKILILCNFTFKRDISANYITGTI